MNLSGVFRQLALSSGVVGVLALACAFFASVTDEPEAGRGLLLSGLIAIFAAMSWAVAVRDIKARVGPKQGIWFVLGFWLLTPLLCMPAFWSSGVADSFIGAYFEAASNLTTLGSSLGDRTLSDVMRIWRSALQFVGGVWSVSIATVVLAAMNQTGPGVQRSHFLTLQRDRLFSQFDKVLVNVFFIYGGAAAVSVIALTAQRVEIVDAITRSVAAITTSATLPGEGDPTAFAMGPSIVLALLLLVGATNVVLHVDLLRRGAWRAYTTDMELISFIMAILVLGAGLNLMRGGLDWRIFAESLSYLSTSGMSVTGIEGVEARLPQPVPEVLSFVGGSALSTAGGIKIARVLLLWSRAGAEFKRLAFSHAKAQLTFRGRSHEDAIIIGVWVYLLAYTGAVGLISLGLTLADVGFNISIRAAVGAISNVGPLVDPALSGDSTSSAVIALLTLGSILGRLEVLAIAPLFTFDFWRR